LLPRVGRRDDGAEERPPPDTEHERPEGRPDLKYAKRWSIPVALPADAPPSMPIPTVCPMPCRMGDDSRLRRDRFTTIAAQLRTSAPKGSCNSTELRKGATLRLFPSRAYEIYGA